jgi:hypothetical protein
MKTGWYVLLREQEDDFTALSGCWSSRDMASEEKRQYDLESRRNMIVRRWDGAGWVTE